MTIFAKRICMSEAVLLRSVHVPLTTYQAIFFDHFWPFKSYLLKGGFENWFCLRQGQNSEVTQGAIYDLKRV